METLETWRPSAPRPLLSGAQAHPGYELVALWGPAPSSSFHPVQMGAEVHAGSPGAALLPNHHRCYLKLKAQQSV